MPTPDSPTGAAPPVDSTDTICQDAAVVGALALLPIPLLDSWLQGRVLEALYARLARERGQTLEPAVLHTLVGFRGSYLMGCLTGVFWWPIKKLFRKIIYVFAIKDALDGAVDAGLRAEMVRRALEAGLLPARADAVRTLMDRCMREHGGSPVWGAVSGHAPVAALQGRGPVCKGVASLAQRGKGAVVLARYDEGLLVLPEETVPGPAPDGDAPAAPPTPGATPSPAAPPDFAAPSDSAAPSDFAAPSTADEPKRLL